MLSSREALHDVNKASNRILGCELVVYSSSINCRNQAVTLKFSRPREDERNRDLYNSLKLSTCSWINFCPFVRATLRESGNEESYDRHCKDDSDPTVEQAPFKHRHHPK